MSTRDDLVSAVEKQGLNKAEAAKAVDAVLGAARALPTATLVFRKVEGRSVPSDDRRTIFLCG